MDLTNLNEGRKKRRQVLDMGNMMFGKVPPQAKEIEEAVLGAIMLEKSAFDTVNDILQPECFYSEANQRIFKAIHSLAGKHLPIDLLTVVEELKLKEDLELVGGPYYVSKLTNNVISSANIEAHSRIVLQKFLLRELIRVGGEMVGLAYEDSTDVFDLLDEAEEKVCGLRMNNVRKNFKSLQSVIQKNLQLIDELRHKDEAITGVESQFPDLDKITCGWQDTDLIILAARPGVGKTAFALTMAKNAAKSFREIYLNNKSNPQKSVAFFSLEMNDRQLVNRVLSAESLIWMWRLKNGKMDNAQMESLYKGAERLNDCHLFIDDTGALKIQEFKTKARILKRKHNVGLIIIDYLQLMKDPTKKMREQEISSISSTLKEMAKELEIPIIALSQLSREFGKLEKGHREPQLSDLRESGAIEQDADMVLFLYPPSESEMAEDASLRSIVYAKIEKFRNGTAPVKFISKFDKDTQNVNWIKCIDEKDLNPIGDTWGSPSNFRTVARDITEPKSMDNQDAKLFIQKGSRMNGFDEDVPF